MDVIQLDLHDRKQVREFIDLPARLYENTPQWVPPLAGDERLRLDPKRYPYYQHSQAAFFIARQDGLILGRLAVLDNRLYNQYNHARTAFFYMFECIEDETAARALLGASIFWAKQRGLDHIMGPRGFTALDGLGLLVKGHELRPALGLPYNPPYYARLLEAVGFQPKEDIISGYLSTDCEFPERIHELAARIQERRGLHIATFKTRRDLRSALGNLESLYNNALSETTDGIPLTQPEIRALAHQMLWFADPQLIKIVMKGTQPVGFLLAYPDISAGIQEIKGRLFPFGWVRLLRELHRTDWININGAGMIKEYRGLGGTAILYSEMMKSATGNPRYKHCEVVQIGLENAAMQREMENFGVNFYKVHRLYEMNI